MAWYVISNSVIDAPIVLVANDHAFWVQIKFALYAEGFSFYIVISFGTGYFIVSYPTLSVLKQILTQDVVVW
jgi:hypothetical protein